MSSVYSEISANSRVKLTQVKDSAICLTNWNIILKLIIVNSYPYNILYFNQKFKDKKCYLKWSCSIKIIKILFKLNLCIISFLITHCSEPL